jgi:hypothetical protein
VIVPDLNLLLYAYNDSSPHHEAARRWWAALLEGTEPVGLPWVVTTGFIRLTTGPHVMGQPATPDRALDTVEEWFGLPHVSPLEPGREHLSLMRQALAATGAGGNLGTTHTWRPWRSSDGRRFTRTTGTSDAFPVCAGEIRSEGSGEGVRLRLSGHPRGRAASWFYSNHVDTGRQCRRGSEGARPGVCLVVRPNIPSSTR